MNTSTQHLEDALSEALGKRANEVFAVEHASLSKPHQLLTALKKARSEGNGFPLVLLHEQQATLANAAMSDHIVAIPFTTFVKIVANTRGKGDNGPIGAGLQRWACIATSRGFWVVPAEAPVACPFCGTDDCITRAAP